MKTYIFKPNGHGQLTFVVIAGSKNEAEILVDNHIQTLPNSYYSQGWSTDYYECIVVEPEQVIDLPND